MASDSTLTAAIWKSMVAEGGNHVSSDSLSKYSSMTPKAAELYCSEYATGDFDWLTKLSLPTMQVLAKGRPLDAEWEPGPFASMSLNGIRQLSPKIARVLATAFNDSDRDSGLQLNGLSKLTDKAAASLCGCSYSELMLNGLLDLSPTTAKYLSTLKGSLLCLNGLTRLSPTAAKHLSNFKGTLSLNGLTQLTDTVAMHLGGFAGDGLVLDGLTNLTDSAGILLCKFKGMFHLNGLKKLSPALARELFNKRGVLSLGGIKKLSDPVAIHVENYELHQFGYGAPFGLHLNGLTQMTNALALSISKLNCAIQLDSVKKLNDFQTRCLVEYGKNGGDAWLELCGLKEISDENLGLLCNSFDQYKLYLSDELLARNKRLRTSNRTIQQLQKHGFLSYANTGGSVITEFDYPADDVYTYYNAKDKFEGTIFSQRIVGADVEELPIWGLSYVINESLHYLGIDTSVVSEEKDEDKFTWICNESRYPILGEGIDDSCYARAAYAIVAILNQLLESSGSKDRAYGVGEGNGFGVAFLNDSLRKIIQREADEEQKPISESQLRKEAKSACGANEPPICIEIQALRTSAELDAQAVRQLQTSLRSKTPESVSRVVNMLEAASATQDQINDVFTPKVISILVNTWDIELWSAMTPVLYLSQSVKEQFTSLVRTRVGKKIPDVYTYRKKGSRFLEEFYSRATDKLVALGHELLPDVPLQLGLEQLSDVAAESLAKHTQSLYLHGLLDLPETVALALTNHSGPWLSLRGVTTLSEAAAERLSRYQGHLVLDGVKSLSDDAAQQLANHKHKLDLPMRHANNVFKQARNLHEVSELLLTKSQISEIQKLLRAKSEDTVKQCLKETAALQLTVADRIEIMTSAVLSRLVNSWDVLVWSELVPLIQPVPLLLREFTELARLRLKQKLPRFHPLYSTELRNQATVFVEDFFARGTAVLLELSEYIIPSEPPVYLDQLKGISKATAHQLAKHPNLELKLGNFSKPAAQILRDAGHGEE